MLNPYQTSNDELFLEIGDEIGYGVYSLFLFSPLGGNDDFIPSASPQRQNGKHAPGICLLALFLGPNGRSFETHGLLYE